MGAYYTDGSPITFLRLVNSVTRDTYTTKQHSSPQAVDLPASLQEDSKTVGTAGGDGEVELVAANTPDDGGRTDILQRQREDELNTSQYLYVTMYRSHVY